MSKYISIVEIFPQECGRGTYDCVGCPFFGDIDLYSKEVECRYNKESEMEND